jgi:Transposase, Mutator family
MSHPPASVETRIAHGLVEALESPGAKAHGYYPPGSPASKQGVQVVDCFRERAQPHAFRHVIGDDPEPHLFSPAEAQRQKEGVLAGRLDEDWERLVTFYAFPQEHWKHLRTSNVVESPFAAVRRRTAAAKRFNKVENATAVIWKTLLVAEQSFRRLDAPERLPEIAEGVVFVDGVREKRGKEKAAA